MSINETFFFKEIDLNIIDKIFTKSDIKQYNNLDRLTYQKLANTALKEELEQSVYSYI